MKFTRSMAPPGACAHLGYQSPTPRYPSAGVGPTKQDRPPSTPAHSQGPLRGPQRRGSPRSTTRGSRPPRHHPPLDTPPKRRVRTLRRCTRSIGLITAARVGRYGRWRRWGRYSHDPVARRRGRCCSRHPPLDQARPTAAGVSHLLATRSIIGVMATTVRRADHPRRRQLRKPAQVRSEIAGVNNAIGGLRENLALLTAGVNRGRSDLDQHNIAIGNLRDYIRDNCGTPGMSQGSPLVVSASICRASPVSPRSAMYPLLGDPGAGMTPYRCSFADRQAKACCRFRGKITCTGRWPTTAEFIGRQTTRRRSDSPLQLR